MARSEKLKVKAGGNGPVFMEGHARRRLDENGEDMNVIRDQAVEVPNTIYYRRRILAGDLVEIVEQLAEPTNLRSKR